MAQGISVEDDSVDKLLNHLNIKESSLYRFGKNQDYCRMNEPHEDIAQFKAHQNVRKHNLMLNVNWENDDKKRRSQLRKLNRFMLK